MMSKCIKEKGWVVTASVSTTPLCNLGGLYQGSACRHSHYPNLLSPPASPTNRLFSVLCLVTLRIAIVSPALCHPPPPPSNFLPSVNIRRTEASTATLGRLALKPHLPSASTWLQFSEAARDCPVTRISSVSKLQLHLLCRLLIACTS